MESVFRQSPEYRVREEARLKEAAEAPLVDPWTESLPPKRPLAPPPKPEPEEDEAQDDGAIEAFFWEKCAEDPEWLPSAAVARGGAEVEVLALLLAGMVLPQASRPDSTNLLEDEQSEWPGRESSR